MEGEAQASNEVPVTATTNDAPAPDMAQIVEQPVQQEAQQTQKPDGFDPVDPRTASPEQIQARIDRLYKNTKRYESKASEMEQVNAVLIEELRQLKENQGRIVTHLQTDDFKNAEQQLKADRQAAWNSGNSAAYDDANDKLRQLDIRRAMKEMAPPPQQQVQQPRPTVDQTVDNSVQRGLLTREEGDTYKAWQNETDNYGQTRRTWLNENDPMFRKALRVGAGVLDSPVFQNRPFGEKLKEIDRLMGIQQPAQANQNVLGGGNLTPPRKNNNVKLTDYEARLAIKTKFGGPKAKSEADHAEAYRQAKIKSQQKGARQ